MSSLLGAGGDRKVTPGVTGSSRARAPIDPAVWYLGLTLAVGQDRGNAIEVTVKKNEYRLITAKPSLLKPGRVGSLNACGIVIETSLLVQHSALLSGAVKAPEPHHHRKKPNDKRITNPIGSVCLSNERKREESQYQNDSHEREDRRAVYLQI